MADINTAKKKMEDNLDQPPRKMSWTNILTWIVVAILSLSIFAKDPTAEFNPIAPYYSITRPIDSTAFIISQRMAAVYYTVNISCTAVKGANSTGRVSLQYFNSSDNVWIDISDVYNSNTVSDVVLSGVVPAGAKVRLVSTSTGNTTISYIRGQEVY